ncbi:3-hydroxybenzoate 6-monooxygenase [Variovorax sp. PCZ-1]|uniref:3-hydroxybenzoate 6-monooxygenase n=1 Tax=Variovorax sp. PCZ-1 TaxID=2835533 RepID=UPI0020BE98DA|nr:3-hydroxybenzoate 6-monooxygenase [Variovorax sp. PCZ-1]
MMFAAASQPILIAGGGIGGLAAAFVLARSGHAVSVLEQAAEFGEIGAGIQLGPNIFRMFDYLGLTEEINKVAYFPPAMGMRDVRTGEQVVRVQMGDAARAAYGGFAYGVIYRKDLHDVLLNACRAQAGITLRTNAGVASFAQDANGVTAQLKNGESIKGAALIGADGLWSGIRQTIVGDGKPRVSGHIAYRAVLRREDVPPELWSDEVQLWGGEKTHLVTYPLRRGELFNLVAVFHSNKYDEGWDTFGDNNELTERFADAHPTVRGLLAKINTWKMWVLCDREPVKNWSQGRATLLGDAAHPMLQYLAQGAGQAIEDAVVLGKAIEHFKGDFEMAFLAYQEKRYLRTARVQLTARFYGDIYHASGVTRELRNSIFQGGKDAAGFAGLKWMYEGIDPHNLF